MFMICHIKFYTSSSSGLLVSAQMKVKYRFWAATLLFYILQIEHISWDLNTKFQDPTFISCVAQLTHGPAGRVLQQHPAKLLNHRIKDQPAAPEYRDLNTLLPCDEGQGALVSLMVFLSTSRQMPG
jgi:hypothetical protein